MAYSFESHDIAWEILERGLSIDPDNAYLLNFAGDLCKAPGRMEDAITYWDKSSAADSTPGGQNTFAKAQLYREIGENEKAHA